MGRSYNRKEGQEYGRITKNGQVQVYLEDGTIAWCLSHPHLFDFVPPKTKHAKPAIFDPPEAVMMDLYMENEEEEQNLWWALVLFRVNNPLEPYTEQEIVRFFGKEVWHKLLYNTRHLPFETLDDGRIEYWTEPLEVKIKFSDKVYILQVNYQTAHEHQAKLQHNSWEPGSRRFPLGYRVVEK